MKKKICSLAMALAVAVTAVNFPAVAGAESNTSGVAVKVTQRESTAEDSVRRMNISAQNHGTEDAVLKIYLLNEDGETADTEVETPDLCEDTPNEMEETLKNALTLADGTSSSLEAEWINETDNSGAVTERYLEAAVPAGAAASFDMQLVYRADEADYTKKTIVKAKAFVNGQEVTKASDGENADNEAEASWETAQSAEESGNGGDSEAIESAAAASKSAAVKSTASTQSAENYAGETRAVSAPADSSITSMYNVPVTYYDYLDDQELDTTWRNIKPYGNNQSNGWSVFGEFNRSLAQYYKDHNLQTPGVYFGNLLRAADSSPGTTRAGEVNSQIDSLTSIYSSYWNNVNNSNYLPNMFYSAQGLVLNALDSEGNLQIASGVKAPWFNEEFLGKTTNGHRESLGKTFNSRFPFRTVSDENGVNYYEFDSNQGRDNVRYNNDGTFSYGQGQGYGVTDNVSADWGLNTDSENGGYGFFPFNYKNSNGANNGWLDFGFGAKLEIRFNLPENGEIAGTNGQKVPVTFQFTGDDDVWVFIDGKLVLDMGGAHKKANGEINFKELTARVTTGEETINRGEAYDVVSLQEALGVSSSAELSPNKAHIMTIFYMERGMIESNLKIRFNMQPLDHEFVAEKDVNVENVNEGLQDTVENADEFNVDLSVNGTAASGKTYQKNDETTGTTDGDGGFTLRDGDQAVFRKQFDDNIAQEFTAQESTVADGKSYLSYDTTWTVVDLENNDKEIKAGNTTTATFTYNKTAGDDFTPVRNKLTYVNTPQTGTLRVTKETVDKENAGYEDDHTEFSFQIMLDMGISTEGYYETPDVTDPDTIYFRVPDAGWSTVYAYCYKLNNGGSNEPWPGQQMEAVPTDSGVYKLDGVIGKYDYVTFSNGSQQYPASGTDYAIGSNNYFYVSSNSLSHGTYTEKGQPQWVPGQKLGYTAYGLTYTVNGETRMAANGSFTLKSGETAVFNGIPVGTRFKIRETSAEGYSLKGMTINGQPVVPDADKYYAGEVASADTGAAVTVTNQKEDTAVNIVAWKTIDEGTETVPADRFTFILEGQQPKEIDGEMSADTSDVRLEEKNAADGKISFDTLTYTEEGVYCYTIKEQIPDSDVSYVYDRTEYEVRVVVTADGDQMEAVTTVTKIKDKDGNAVEPAEKVEDITRGIRFDNTTNLATLSVQKWLVKEDGTELEKSSWPNRDVRFSFLLEVRNEEKQWVPCANQPYLLYEGEEGVPGNTNSAGIFSIRAQETDSPARIEFQNLVIGKEYRVTELLNDRPQYEFFSLSVDGSERHPVPAVGVREYSTGAIQIKKGGNQVLYKNYPLSSITVEKQDENGAPLQGAEFTLKKWDENGGSWIQHGDPAISGSDGIARFSNLHAGKYRITEVRTKAGYVLLKEPIKITLPYEYKAGSIVNGSEVNADGTAYNITFTVINGQAFDLPQSGRKGIGPLAAAGMAVVVMAGTAFAARNIRGQKAVSRRRKRRPR